MSDSLLAQPQATDNPTLVLRKMAAALWALVGGLPSGEQFANVAASEYKTVAASQTGSILGSTGAVGDYLAGLLVIPASTSPGAITIKDGAGGTDITVFAGGSSSLSNLASFFIPINATALSTGWRVTTGANVSVLATGNFT